MTACAYEDEVWHEAGGDIMRPGGLALTRRALELCALPAQARLLDIGCGCGASVSYARSEHCLAAIGVDQSAVLLQRGRKNCLDLPLLRAAGERLPLATASVDAILAECSLSAAADQEAVLRECYRVLKPGGCLLLSDIYIRNPAAMAALHCLLPGSCLSGALSREQIDHQLLAQRFRIELWEDHSETLRPFAARIIAASGSLEPVWGQTAVPDPFDLQLAVARARPGYCLLRARKDV